MASPNIRIDIASEFKDRGFKRASRATTGLERQFKSLGKTVIAVFSARQIIRFTQDSVRAFAQEDRAVRALSGTLNNLGLAMQGAGIENFVSEMQRTTAVADDQLRPALQQLATTTLDVQKAQTLLGLALDISAGTGKDLSAVVNGLSRAYLKDVSALARLNLGLTGAQLSTMSFEEAQAALQDRFTGQAAAAADSYQGKIAKLSLAFDEAREVVGQKFIKALENVAEGDFDKVITAIGNAAEFVGNGFTRASYGVRKLKAALGGDFDQVRKLQEAMDLELAGGFGARGFVPASQLQKQQQQQNQLLRRLEAERRKAANNEKKRLREQQSLKRAGTVFDMENIQIVAAMQGKVTEDQRLRLVALLALNNGNAEAADKLTSAILAANSAALKSVGVIVQAGDNADTVISKLINAQTKLALVELGIKDLPKAKNPFSDWDDVIARILDGIAKIKSGLNNLSGNENQVVPVPVLPTPGTPSITPPSGNPGGRLSIPGSGNNFIVPDDGGGSIIPTPIIPIPDSSAGGSANDFFGDNNGTIGRGGDVGIASITVNVSGTVIQETDLVNRITNAIYNVQKSGQPITYSTSI